MFASYRARPLLLKPGPRPNDKDALVNIIEETA